MSVSRTYDQLLKGAISGNSDDLVAFNLLLASKKIDEKDIQKTLLFLHSEIENNNSYAMWALSQMHFFSQALEKDYAKIYELLERAVNLGNPYAMKDFANGFYQSGDYKKAESYYKKAIQNGCLIAGNGLGCMYKEGHIGQKDSDDNFKHAEYYFKLAADAGNTFALINLADLWFSVNDYQKVKYYYELAAKEDNAFAAYQLGVLYLFGHADGTPNYNEAKYWLRKALSLGYSDAIPHLITLLNQYPDADIAFTLGCYSQGVLDNYFEAIEYFELAAKLGNAKAAHNLALIYDFGLINNGIPDYEKAVYWYEIGAKGGDYQAAYNLGLLYYSGFNGFMGMEPNYIKAQEYLELSLKLGGKKSEFLGYTYFYRTDVNNDIRQQNLINLIAIFMDEILAILTSTLKMKPDERKKLDIDISTMADLICKSIAELKSVHQKEISLTETTWNNFFKRYFDIEYCDYYGNSLVHIALLCKNENFARYLIDAGIDLNQPNNELLTPLNLAAIQDLPQLAAFLIEKGATVKASGFPCRIEAAELARQNGHILTEETIKQTYFALQREQHNKQQKDLYLEWAEINTFASQHKKK